MLDYGRRLLVDVVQERAKQGHTTPFAFVPKTADIKDGFYDISYAQLERAVTRCAHLLDQCMPAASTDFETFAWMGHASDIRYPILLLAAMKTRRKAFFPSPRNHKAAHLALLDSCDCTTFLTPSTLPPPMVADLARERPLHLVPVPELAELLKDDPDLADYPYSPHYDQASLDPVCVLHTSGSTGIPKIVVLRHQYFASLDAWQLLPQMGLEPMALSTLPPGARTLCGFPFFHCAGILHASSVPIYYDQPVVVPPLTPIHADLLDQMHQALRPDFSMIPNPIIKDLLADPAYRQNLASVSLVGFGGGQLPFEIGTDLATVTRGQNTFGMTETAMMPYHMLEPADFEYMSFSPVLGADFREISPGQYEMVIVRKTHLALFQGVFTTFPDLHEFHTNDIWAPHPSKPNLWRHCCRFDDVIVFSNGEKLNPTAIEARLMANQRVKGALVGGSGRFQACLLIEPAEPVADAMAAVELLQALAPDIADCNRHTVAHGKISPDAVLVASRNKPFLRSGKGVIQRKPTLDSYQDEIDSLYDNFESQNPSPTADRDGSFTSTGDYLQARLSDTSRRRCIEDQLRDTLTAVLGTEDIPSTKDFFSLGMDSLQATTLARYINKDSHYSPILAKHVYAHPSIDKLAEYMSATALSANHIPPERSREDRMQGYLDKFTAALPIVARTHTSRQGKKLNVLFTGTTGSLGTYSLDALLTHSDVEIVHCYNRSSNASERQLKSHTRRGLTTDFSKARFYHGDLLKPYLGLAIDEYRTLLGQVNVILHNAWPVDFNMSIDSFEPHMAGVGSLVNFSACSTHAAPVLFSSSISTVMSSAAYAGRAHPETESHHWSSAESMGYAESKLVAERILARASQVCGVKTTSMRIGQIAGPVKSMYGEWPKQEWLPSLIASSKFIGALPTTLGAMDRIDWTPVDILAHVVRDLLFATAHDDGQAVSHTRIHHVVNPCQVQWSDLVDSVSSHLAHHDKTEIEQVPVEDWVQRLSASSTDDLEANPAAKIPEFFDSFVRDNQQHATLDVSQTRQASVALDQLRAVSPEWMRRWMLQWQF